MSFWIKFDFNVKSIFPFGPQNDVWGSNHLTKLVDEARVRITPEEFFERPYSSWAD